MSQAGTTLPDPATMQSVQPVVSNAVAQLGGTNVATAHSVWDWLNADQQTQARALATKFNPKQNVAAISTFGGTVLQQIADVTKPILNTVRARDAGPAKDVLAQFTKQIMGVNFDLAYHEPNFFQKAIKALDPLVQFLNSLRTIESLMDQAEAKFQETSGQLVGRMTTLDQMKQKAERAIPQLAAYAGAAELVLTREEDQLHEMEASLGTSTDPALAHQINEQRTMVTRLRVLVYNLREAYMKSWLMIPVVDEAIKASMMVNDEVIQTVVRTMPDMRMMLAVLIAQYDAASAAGAVMDAAELRRQTTAKLAEQLGQTSQTVDAMLEDKTKNVASMRDLRDKLVAVMQHGIEQDARLKEQFEQAYEAFDEITTSMKQAVTDLNARSA